jgi:hypothetical protein
MPVCYVADSNVAATPQISIRPHPAHPAKNEGIARKLRLIAGYVPQIRQPRSYQLYGS